MKRLHCLLLVLLLTSPLLAETEPQITLSALPSIHIPLGPTFDDGTDLYSLGGGLNLQLSYPLPFFPLLSASAHTDFDLHPLNGPESSITLISGGAGLGISVSPLPRFSIGAGVYTGIYMGMIEQGSVRNPFAAAYTDLSYRLSPSLSVALGGVYKHHFSPDGAVYQGLGVNLGMRYKLGGSNKDTNFSIEPQIQPIFPLFYSYYDANPAGTVKLRNNEESSLTNIRVSFYVKQFMEQAKLCAEYDELLPGTETELPIYALFTDDIFRITEGSKVAGEVRLEYSYFGTPQETTIPVTVTINNRNAMTWDDDRKAAAFVTAKDPSVLHFSKNSLATMRNQNTKAVNRTFRTAMILFEALGVYGISYVIDPASSYSVLSEQSDALDFIQFPNQTLAYKAGDCDDLTIMYSALLEAVGIETAFITIPGHIYMAFQLEMNPRSAGHLFSKTEDLIFKDGKTWIPIEITLVQEGFLKAWRIGAKQWRESKKAGTAAFYPIREAWNLYEPVGFNQGGTALVLPDSRSLIAQYSESLNRFIEREIGPQKERLQTEMKRSGNEIKYRNKLGILYARYGRIDNAIEEFEAIIAKRDYLPAMINLGNAYFLQEEMERALGYYKKALEMKPESPGALLGLARASYELEDYSTVNISLEQLKEHSPETAARFSYLGSQASGVGRASEALSREIEQWDEEEE